MKNFLFFLFFVLLFSCNKDDKFELRGRIKFDNGIIAKNSQVYIDGVLKTTTNSDGNFIISDLSSGKYKLNVNNTDSLESFSEVEMDIELKNKDLDLESLLLPVPVKIETTEISSNSIKLKWNKCNSSDFREYKIYICSTSGLDEDSGTLLSILTNVNDTILTVNEGDFWWGGATLTPNSTYYFRVFVMNSYGRMSGSNILEVTTVLWDNADDFTNNYNLLFESSFAAQGNLTGIAWDGNYFWMLYFEYIGGYNDNNRATLIKYNYEQGTSLDTIVLDDSNFYTAGITWDGTNVWISFGEYIQSVNIINEVLDKKYYVGESSVDLAWNNENLLLLDVWNKVTIINPLNGSISNQFNTPFIEIGYSGEKGIAYRTSEIWIINNWHNEICILDETGNHIGVAEVDFLQEGLTSNGHLMPMCFMNNKLVIAFDSQVRIYTIEPK